MKNFQKLPDNIKEKLLNICNKSITANTLVYLFLTFLPNQSFQFSIFFVFRFNEDDKDVIHEYYLYLNGIPNALAKVFLSFRSWDYSSIINFNEYLKHYDTLNLAESFELLLPLYYILRFF